MLNVNTTSVDLVNSWTCRQEHWRQELRSSTYVVSTNCRSSSVLAVLRQAGVSDDTFVDLEGDC